MLNWRIPAAAAVGLLAVSLNVASTRAAEPPPSFPKFKTQEIASDLTIGYATILVDLNGDKKPDIVVVDKHRVVWYENPTWKMRTILQGKTAPDNVCITALDIDGNGDLELVVGAAWKPFDTKNPGTLQWLKRGKTLDEEWTMYPIACDEPTVHRIRAIDLDGDGKAELVNVPLMGRDSTKEANWMDGRPIRATAYLVPNHPEKPESWRPVTLDDTLHVVHNFDSVADDKAQALLFASYDGVFLSRFKGERFQADRIHSANQANPKGNRGAREIKGTRKVGDALTIATIEPWHGNQVVTYTVRDKPDDSGNIVDRNVIDEQLRWGHAVWFADVDSDGVDELIIGVRDDPNPKLGDKFTERRGVRIYKCTDGKGAKWDRFILENGGVAVEDLAAADLDGDGKIDIVAVGRATGNCRIYWNQGR